MDEIVSSLSAEGIVHPFPIQEFALPLALDGVDVIGQARTGTGKTLAFGVAALQRITLPGDYDFDDFEYYGKPQALVVCPTRELAIQVAKEVDTAGHARKARVTTIYGGVPYESQLAALKTGVDIVVGTPGRLLDLQSRNDLDLSNVSVMVIDEADEMLDLGFLPDVERLLAAVPQERQTMLFSATMPSAVMSLARTYMNRAVNIRAEGQDAQATVPDTKQFVYQAHDLDKPEVIGRILQASDIGKVMIFCKTKRAAQRLSDDLADRGFSVTAIHGDLNQSARERALRKFRKGTVNVLVATDVAARGIDVSGVSHVINCECPDDAKTYVHRIGRTGRAGAKGVAVTLVDWQDVVRWKLLNKDLQLNFDEPQETYSTSPHLYSDLDIPEDTRGFLPGHDPAAVKPREHSDKDKRPRISGRNSRNATHGKSNRSEAEGRGEAPNPKRTKPRRRLRNGQPVERPSDEN